MTYVKNNIDSSNMDFSTCVLFNLYSQLRIYKQHIVNCGAVLEDKSYKTVVRCENEAGKRNYYTYFLCESALEAFSKALLEDYEIVVYRA